MNFFIVVLVILCFIYIYKLPTTETFDYTRRNKQINDLERLTGCVTTTCDRASYSEKECACNMVYDKTLNNISEFRYNDEKLIDMYDPVYSQEPCSNTQLMGCRDM